MRQGREKLVLETMCIPQRFFAGTQGLFGALSLGDIDPDPELRLVRKAHVGPRALDLSSVTRLHVEVLPLGKTSLHEPSRLVAVARVGIALLHQRYVGQL